MRRLGPVFLALVGITAAEASQAVGALLLFGLLAAPPAAAQRLTARPWTALALAGCSRCWRCGWASASATPGANCRRASPS